MIDTAMKDLRRTAIRFGEGRAEKDWEACRGLVRRLAGHPPEARLGLAQEMTGLVREGKAEWPALLPFLSLEAHPAVVSTAAIDVAMVVPPNELFEELPGPRFVLRLIEDGHVQAPGAAFGGLLHLGDERVNALLGDVRDQLSLGEVEQAIHCRTGVISHALMAFYLDWLLDLPGDDEDRLFGALSSAIQLEWTRAAVERVYATERVFPGTDLLDPVLCLNSWTKDEYAEAVAPTLWALAFRESSPKVLPGVAAALGIPIPPEWVPPFFRDTCWELARETHRTAAECRGMSDRWAGPPAGAPILAALGDVKDRIGDELERASSPSEALEAMSALQRYAFGYSKEHVAWAYRIKGSVCPSPAPVAGAGR